MLNSERLQQLIGKILNNELSGSELNLYIRYCASLAAAFLVYRKRAGKLDAEYLGDENSEIQKLALDSIAELFAQDSQNNFYQLQEYYRPLEPLIMKDADQALFMTRRLIVAHAKQSLVKQFAIKDPAGAKIYRNLTLVPQRDPSIKMINYGDSEYFFRWDKPREYTFPQDFNPEKPEITREAGLRILGDRDGDRSTLLPALVKRFLDFLSQETDYRHFISRTQLFGLLKHILSFQTTVFGEYETISSSDGGQHDQVTEEVQQDYLAFVKAFHRSEIVTRYETKKKISPAEVAVYCQILDQYFEDSVLDGSPCKLPEYRDDSAFRDLDETNWKLHRGRLEYLVKLGRQALKEKYRHDFLKRDAMVIEDE